MKRRPNRAGYAVLDSLANPLWARIVGLTAAELYAARKAVDELSETNCGWFVYRCRDLLRAAIGEWLTDRVPPFRCSECEQMSVRLSRANMLVCFNHECYAKRRLRRGERARLDAAGDLKWVKRRRRAKKKVRAKGGPTGPS